jgi:crossover junction endonuclease EME1
METGQVKAGDDARDIFVRALQQVVRVTAPIAYGIAAHYPDVPSLVDAFLGKGDLALEDIQVRAYSHAQCGIVASLRLTCK